MYLKFAAVGEGQGHSNEGLDVKACTEDKRAVCGPTTASILVLLPPIPEQM